MRDEETKQTKSKRKKRKKDLAALILTFFGDAAQHNVGPLERAALENTVRPCRHEFPVNHRHPGKLEEAIRDHFLVDNLLGRHFPQALDDFRHVVGGSGGGLLSTAQSFAQFQGPFQGDVRGERGPRARGTAAAHDGLVEEVAGDGREHVQGDAGRARGLPEHGDVVGIPSEGLDVVTDPAHRLDLVVHGGVAGDLFGAEVEEAQRADAVLRGHDYHVFLRGQHCAVVNVQCH